MEKEFEEITSVNTKRNRAKDPTPIKAKRSKIKPRPPKYQNLFNIHPYHIYNLGLKYYNYDPKMNENDIDDLLKINDIKDDDYTEYKRIVKVFGNMKIVKYIKAEHPIIGNHIQKNWNLISIVNDTCPPSWREAFKIAFKEILAINDLLIDEETAGRMVCPSKSNIFRAFELCPLNNIKVVILGQDPYHTVFDDEPVANGLSFSTEKNYRIQPSLRNIYKLLSNTGFQSPNHGDLSSWAQQGVLLLNTALTTVKHKPGEHSVHWGGFTTHIISVINKVKPECVYMLWGKNAISMKKHIYNIKNILEANHPSPMVRNSNFMKCDHFNKANEILRSFNQSEIDWTIT